jgi:hypothetical protein
MKVITALTSTPLASVFKSGVKQGYQQKVTGAGWHYKELV